MRNFHPFPSPQVSPYACLSGLDLCAWCWIQSHVHLFEFVSVCVRVHVCVRMRACVRSRVCMCLRLLPVFVRSEGERGCVHASLHAYACMHVHVCGCSGEFRQWKDGCLACFACQRLPSRRCMCYEGTGNGGVSTGGAACVEGAVGAIDAWS